MNSIKPNRVYSSLFLHGNRGRGLMLRGIHGRGFGSFFKKAAKFGLKNAVPILKDIGSDLGSTLLPALGSVVQDKINSKGGPSFLSDAIGSASSAAGRKLGESKKQTTGAKKGLADFISNQASRAVASKFSGSGPRNIGTGPRNVGRGLLEGGAFSSLSLNRAQI